MYRQVSSVDPAVMTLIQNVRDRGSIPDLGTDFFSGSRHLFNSLLKSTNKTFGKLIITT